MGKVGKGSLARALKLLDSADSAHLRIVACHHPLVDKEGLESSGRTLGGRAALEALAGAGPGADVVLSGHVHDPFDVVHQFGQRTIRTVGAGTLSERLRSTPPSFNELVIDGRDLHVVVRTMDNKPAQVLETRTVDQPA
jgi:predicted phosphodiesterase